MKKDKIVAFEVAKFFACLMIINSHCRDIYPVSYLAIGGAFGNSIFFIISGYFNYGNQDKFDLWIKKKIERLVPFMVVMIGLEEVVSYIFKHQWINAKDIIDQYWFVFALLIYMLITYPIIGMESKKWIMFNIAAGIAVYSICYIINFQAQFFVELEGFRLIKIIEYFIVYSLGLLIRQCEDMITHIISRRMISNFKLMMWIIVSIGGWGIMYFYVLVLGKLFRMQILIPICIVILGGLVLLTCIKNKKMDIKNQYIKNTICCIAESTLEIYILQVTYLKFIKIDNFVLGYLCLWGISLIGGCLCHQCTKTVRKVLAR